MSDLKLDISKAVKAATKKWTKQRKAEERSAKASLNRCGMYSSRIAFTDVAKRVLQEAYQHASGGLEYPVSRRQLYYASRDDFQTRTGRQIAYGTFNSLLTAFCNRHPSVVKDWRLTADPRGTLLVPNTYAETRVPCGTLQIDAHLDRAAADVDIFDEPDGMPSQWPSLAGGQRFQGVLYIEKEGFEPLLKQARIAERYDLAVLSCKGQSVTAARKFVDETCAAGRGVPLLIAHDCDIYGFSIAARLTSVSDRASWDDRVAERIAYHFQNDIDYHDLGLRWADAKKYRLVTESCKRVRQVPEEYGCTAGELELFASGQRVELNAFSAPQFLEWLEAGIRAAGITERLVPDNKVLRQAYRRAVIAARVNAAMRVAYEAAVEGAADIEVPDDLRAQVMQETSSGGQAWDVAVYEIAESEVDA